MRIFRTVLLVLWGVSASLLLIWGIVGCDEPVVEKYYGCAPRAGLNLLKHWDEEGYWTPLREHTPTEVESILAVAMKTSPSGNTSVYDIEPGLEKVCPTWSVWSLIPADTAAYYQSSHFLYCDHVTKHVWYLPFPDRKITGPFSLIYAYPVEQGGE